MLKALERPAPYASKVVVHGTRNLFVVTRRGRVQWFRTSRSVACHSIDSPFSLESSSSYAPCVRTTSRRCSRSPRIPSSGSSIRNQIAIRRPRSELFEDALASGGAVVALDRATGQIIGSSRYHGYDAEGSVIEIGWTFLARSHWGGRYNGEMKRLMLVHAFKSVHRVIFIIGPDNRRSQRAVEKIGGVRSGTTTDARGRARVVYELTPALYARRAESGVA